MTTRPPGCTPDKPTATVATAYICAPAAAYYVARVREYGRRKYAYGPHRKRKSTAMRDMLRMFEARLAKRAHVVAFYDWYDPHICCELVRRR